LNCGEHGQVLLKDASKGGFAGFQHLGSAAGGLGGQVRRDGYLKDLTTEYRIHYCSGADKTTLSKQTNRFISGARTGVKNPWRSLCKGCQQLP